MNKRQRDFWYPQIAKKQGGEYCVGCGKSIKDTTEKLLLIDHIDNNNSNNILTNMQLLCRSCNRIKNPEKNEHFIRPMTPEMIKNKKGEPKFRNWLFTKVSRDRFITWDEAVNAGAEYTRMSREAIRGYLLKVTSSEGIYDCEMEDEQGNQIVYFRGEDSLVMESMQSQRGIRA